jgi:hypothetical protein
VPKVTLSIDEEVLAEARDAAGPRQLSAYVTEAVRRQLHHDRLGRLLDELDDDYGPVPEEMMEEARNKWRDAEEALRKHPRSA